MAFYKKLVLKQVEIGAQSEDAITDNFKMQSGFIQVMKDKVFWAEVFMLILAPYPHKGGVLPKRFQVMAINWVDNSGTYSAHTHAYPVTYQNFDILTVACFIRIYFVLQALLAVLPMNQLSSKRTCQEAGFNAGFTFQLKAAFKKFPYIAFFVIGAIAVSTFAYIIRIWERPYYELALSEPFFDFKWYGSAVWYVLISMTTVGYGNIVATTPYGRISVILAILFGSFLLSLLVGLIINWFSLPSN